MKQTTLSKVRLLGCWGRQRRGFLKAGAVQIRCVLGRSGRTVLKREGDGASPKGCFPLLTIYVRRDRGPRPRTLLPIRTIRPLDGWCDDPRHAQYNRPIKRPTSARHEALWREDGFYDILIDLAWNRGPIRHGRGSAIFLHVARDGVTPTEGCVAVSLGDLRKLLGMVGPRTCLHI